jgi:cupin 2 domain-containing protein
MANIFEAIPEHLKDELTESLVENPGLRIERIVSRGHRSPASGWYDQDRNEWVMVLRGEAVLDFEAGESLRMKPGDYLDIPAHRKHRVAWTACGVDTVWLAVQFTTDFGAA